MKNLSEVSLVVHDEQRRWGWNYLFVQSKFYGDSL